MSHTKIKVIATSAAQWATIINHAQKLGAVSRDNQYGFNPEKTAMVIENNYIKYSSPTMKPKAGVAVPLKISVDEFLQLSSLHDAGFIGKQVNPAVAIAAAKKAMPCAQDTLKVSACDVLVQNAVIWSTVGLPKLKSLGVEVTTLGDVDYIIDVKTNSAEPFNAETASAQAKADLLEGKVTAYTTWAKECDLIDNLVLAKTLPDAE